MATTKTHRLTIGNHGRFEDGQPVKYRKGEEIILNEREARNLAGRVELIGSVPEPVANDSEDTNDFAQILEGSIPTVREHVATLEDPETLQALYDAEVVGKNRSGALNVIGERLAELEVRA